MRLMNRNSQTIYYALFTGKQAQTDSQGYETGEYKLNYTSPKKLKCSVSSASGQSQIEVFGNIEGYDRVILTDNMKCPIDENSIIWIDTETDKGHDYIVKRVAKSLNVISILVTKVKVNG